MMRSHRCSGAVDWEDRASSRDLDWEIVEGTGSREQDLRERGLVGIVEHREPGKQHNFDESRPVHHMVAGYTVVAR